MHFFSSDASADTISRLHGSLTEVKQITLESIEKVCSGARLQALRSHVPAIDTGALSQLLDRGERLELLVSKTDNLQAGPWLLHRWQSAHSAEQLCTAGGELRVQAAEQGAQKQAVVAQRPNAGAAWPALGRRTLPDGHRHLWSDLETVHKALVMRLVCE